MQNLKLTWPGDSSATYEVQYKKSSDSSWTVPPGSPVVGLTLNINGLLDNTSYNFRLRVLCLDSVGSWLYSQYTTSSASCVAVTGLSISTITETGFYVSWTAQASAVGGYRVQYRKQGTTSWLSSPVTTSTILALGGLDSGSAYDVRVLGFCTGGVQSTSAKTTGTTLTHYTQSALITTSISSITKNDANYTVLFSNSGGTPSTEIVEFSLDDGATWDDVIISNQNSTSVTYSIPEGDADFPATHLLRLTPKCADNSTGTSDTEEYTAPDVPTQFVIFRNDLNSANISFINIDGTSNILTSSISPSGSTNWNQTGLFTGTHQVAAEFSGLQNGTKLVIEQTRSASVINTQNASYLGGRTIIEGAIALQDGDEIAVSENGSIYNFAVTSTLAGVQVSAISGPFTIYDGTYPMPSGGRINGTHTAFSTAISVTVTGTPPLAGSVSLSKNGTLIQCRNVTAAGTFTFTPVSFLATDAVYIGLNTGTC